MRLTRGLCYTYLSCHGYKKSVGQIGPLECDFIARKGNDYFYVQVAMSIADRDAEELAGIDPETGKFFHENHAYDIRQTQGKHYARSMRRQVSGQTGRKASDYNYSGSGKRNAAKGGETK